MPDVEKTINKKRSWEKVAANVDGLLRLLTFCGHNKTKLSSKFATQSIHIIAVVKK